MPRGGAHRLDLAMRRVEFLQRAAAQQFAVLPGAPECDAGCAQCIQGQRVHARRRRILQHVLHVLPHEQRDFRTAQVVDSDFHGIGHLFREMRSSTGSAWRRVSFVGVRRFPGSREPGPSRSCRSTHRECVRRAEIAGCPFHLHRPTPRREFFIRSHGGIEANVILERGKMHKVAAKGERGDLVADGFRGIGRGLPDRRRIFSRIA